MRQITTPSVKATLSIIAVLFLSILSTEISAQQHIIVNKDNTRPEMDRQYGSPGGVSVLTANAFQGYNEVAWNVSSAVNVKSFIVEFSVNALDYQSAAEILPAGNQYRYRHTMATSTPVLYRVRTIEVNGATRYSVPFFLGSESLSPVVIYPTVVTGNMINIKSGWPVERVNIISSNGTQVFTKEINGQRDFIPLAIPSLGKGMYWVAFFGNGWKTTQKILIS